MASEKRLIDAKPLIENGWHLVKTGESNGFLAQMSLADVPIVDAVEVVHAKKAESAISNTGLMCTACHSDIDRDAVFCKYCGAKMDGGNEDG